MLNVKKKVKGFVPNTTVTDEPTDRNEETRAYINELEARLVRIEDILHIRGILRKEDPHVFDCATRWGDGGVCTCPGKK